MNSPMVYESSPYLSSQIPEQPQSQSSHIATQNFPKINVNLNCPPYPLPVGTANRLYQMNPSPVI